MSSYLTIITRMRRRILIPFTLIALFTTYSLNGQESEFSLPALAPFEVTSERSWGKLDALNRQDRIWDTDAITQTAPRTLDQVLYQEPSFSLYRRQNSLFSAPQAQGVSLRSIGATAAPRTLVLRDGIPQNDPFGGWVPWARYTPGSIEFARILPGNQAAAWGHQSAGGVIMIDSVLPQQEVHRAQLTAGSFNTIAADTQHSFTHGRHGFYINLATSDSDGDDLIDSSDRGSIDKSADFETSGVDVRHHFQINEAIRLESAVSYYEEDRSNGTPATHYNTEAWDLSLRLVGNFEDQEWSASVYYQNRSLDSVFSSVNTDRSAETPVLDQYDTPADGVGGNVVFATEDFQHIRLVTGADIRHLNGATHEDVLIPNRRRKAGGEQTITGAFVTLANQPEQLNQYELNVRMDYWSLNDGHHTETSKSTGVQTRDDHYSDRNDWEPSISVATAHQLADSLRLNLGSGYTFRLPTINELYRPYRVGGDITEANTDLGPERFFNLEAGLTWQAREQLSLRTGVFQYWIDDAIANVRTTAPAGVFVPPGGSYNQRQNVDSATVFGWETRLEYAATDTLTFALNYLYTQAEFEDSNVQPEFEGNSFPQVPTHKATASVDYQINQQLLLFGTIEYGSSQYDDPLNDRKLTGYMTGQVGASYQLTHAIRLVGRVDNLADATVITGERSNGVRSIAPGRSFWLSILIDW